MTEGKRRPKKTMPVRRLNLRKKLWPDVDEDKLWSRKKENGFISIPRYLSYVMVIMDKASKGKPLSSTYFSLWCHVFDESIVVVENSKKMAFEVGFQGQRAESTWRGRMKILSELGFIKAKEGSAGEYHYVLIIHPYLVVSELKEKGLVESKNYNSLLQRMTEIGAM